MTTPMMQQYRDAKERHPGMLLLFRLGEFFELFHEDAEVGARVLGLTLTARDGNTMAGIPMKALDNHLRTLLRAGHRVAICDQVEDAALAKGLVRREITRVVTPGTLTEDDLLDPRQANHLVALAPQSPSLRGTVGVAWVDLSTGQFHAADVTAERILDHLARLCPAEVLLAEGSLRAGEVPRLLERLRAIVPGVSLGERPDWCFDPTTAGQALRQHFAVTTMAGFGFEDQQPCLTAAGVLVQYLQETLRAGLGHVSRLRPFAEHRFLFLDEVTRRSLELVRTLREGERSGSLLSLLDRTVTAMGARLLHDCVLTPLAELAPIEARLDAVGELVDEHALRQDLRAALQEAFDLQRLTARIGTGRATPRDLAAVGRTLRLLPRLKARITARRAAILRDIESRLELCPDLREMLENALVAEPPISAREGGVIRRGYDPDLDELHQIATSGKEWIANFQAEEITRTGISSLKVGFNQVFGYYIEITHAHKNRIPADYQRKQTLKNAERYITPELKAYEEKVLTAEEKIHQRELDLFVALRERVAEQTQRLLQTAEAMAWLDVLAGLAELATERGYCRPKLVDEPILHIVEGRHPVLDQTLPAGTFVPNDVHFGPEAGGARGDPPPLPVGSREDPPPLACSFLLITGPNMGGKSCYIRQVALLTLMAQMGSFIPAKEATIGLADRIFTRVGASDELSRAQSTFMVEMTEAANILNNATARSLVVLDEIGRGTSTYDGVSLAWGISEYLHDTIGCRTLFATHYHELAELQERLPRFRNLNALVHEDADGIVFLHKLAPGSADKSYGIHVAHRAGVPEPVLERARQVLAELEAMHEASQPTPEATIAHPRMMQASLFAGTQDPVLAALRDLDLRRLTAEQVVEQVRRWQRELGRRS